MILDSGAIGDHVPDDWDEEAWLNGRSRKPVRPRKYDFVLQRKRRPDIPRGICARGRRRSTNRSLHLGRIRQSQMLEHGLAWGDSAAFAKSCRKDAQP